MRDLLIAGLGDSIAAGEGNPDRPVALSDEGFCFRRFGTGSEYYRPGRATYTGDRTCEARRSAASELAEWTRLGARWMSQACHRSLYGYQFRTALALAVENPHVAVTFLPLACTGATIETGVLGSQRARELNCTPDKRCPSTVPAQITQLQQYLAAARRTRPDRTLDLVLLTVGANDIDFSGLVANVIIDATARARAVRTQRDPVGRSRAESALTRTLPARFREAARGAEADGRRRSVARRVRLVRPSGAARRTAAACGGGQTGFDVHPVVQARRRAAAPRRRISSARASCRVLKAHRAMRGQRLRQSGDDRMTFVDAHQQAFVGHGVCARSEQDPEFDRACFLRRRQDASPPVRSQGATEPLTCGAAGRGIPRLRAARALDPHRERQLFRRDDLSGRTAGDLAADRHP